MTDFRLLLGLNSYRPEVFRLKIDQSLLNKLKQEGITNKFGELKCFFRDKNLLWFHAEPCFYKRHSLRFIQATASSYKRRKVLFEMNHNGIMFMIKFPEYDFYSTICTDVISKKMKLNKK